MPARASSPTRGDGLGGERRAMVDPEKPAKDGKDKEAKIPKTKPMPHQQLEDFTSWVQQQPAPDPEDKGKQPPAAPQDTPEPREAGASEPDE
jgi:hypothetical protein